MHAFIEFTPGYPLWQGTAVLAAGALSWWCAVWVWRIAAARRCDKAAKERMK